MMKKLSLYIFLVLMWCNVGFAETMNELLDDNYKITKEELVKFDTYAYKIFTLKADSLKILQRKIKNSKKEKVFLKYTPLEIK